MATLPWHYLSNSFEVRTRGTNVKMLSIVTDTHAKLSNEVADPDIQLIFNDLDPVYDAYRQVSINYDMVAGNYEGDTLSFENIMEQVPTELRKWEGGIRAVYFEDTPEERAIFPNKRSPFLQGTYEDKVGAIGTLAEKLATDPALAATHALVQSFYNNALSSRLAQQATEGNIGLLSDLREEQRLLVATELYRVLARLMAKFYQDPAQVERFFDLELLRSTGVSDNGGSNPGPTEVNISGTVRDINTNMPIEGATVVIFDGGAPDENSPSATTDENGEYTINIPDVPEGGPATLQANAEGYFQEQQPIEIEPDTDYDDRDFNLTPEA